MPLRMSVLNLGRYPPARLISLGQLQREMVAALGYTHDPQVLAPIAAMVSDDFVDALTLAGTVDDVAARLLRMVEHGVRHIMISPVAADGDVESIIRIFAQQVMPRVRQVVPSGSRSLH